MGFVPNFCIDTFEGGSGTTLKVAGELDSATSGELLARFEAAVASPGRAGTADGMPERTGTGGARSDAVVIDLEAVSFIDSSGMRALILIERRAKECGIELTLARPPAHVSELLEVTGVAMRVAVEFQPDASPPAAQCLERMELALPREPTAPGQARAELREAMGGRLSDSDLATATLLTSELVTNAVIHPDVDAGDTIELNVISWPDRLRVEVIDLGEGFDLERLPPRPRENGGHGLLVVAGLSSRWGTAPRPAAEGGGFCVWFELDVAADTSREPGTGEPATREPVISEGARVGRT